MTRLTVAALALTLLFGSFIALPDPALGLVVGLAYGDACYRFASWIMDKTTRLP